LDLAPIEGDWDRAAMEGGGGRKVIRGRWRMSVWRRRRMPERDRRFCRWGGLGPSWAIKN